MRKLRKLSNCLIVAAVVWVSAMRKGRKPYVYVRPSFHFKGLVPHSGVAMKRAFRELAVIEACPPKADLWTRKNVLVLFEPTYRVWVLRPVRVGRYATRQEAERAAERINR